MVDQHFSAHGPLTKGRVTHFSACGLGGEGGADQHFLAHGTETDDDDELMLDVLRCHLTY